MGGPVFDRQVFVKKNQMEKPPSRSPLPGGLVLLLVAALSAFATYRYVKAGGKSPSNPADKAQIAELQTKLKAMQDHVQELEKRRRAARTTRASSDVKPTNTSSATREQLLTGKEPTRAGNPATTQLTVPTNAAGATSDPSFPNRAASAAPPPATPPAQAAQPAAQTKPPVTGSPAISNKELSALKGNVAATHEEWQATANRLGNVVGELDSQRSAIKRTQTGVNYLLERAQSSSVPFTLRKGEGFQHVGPISLRLDSSSVKGQHYNVRMLVDDKTIVLKDRALNEVVQFYTSRSKYPLRLIVAQIGRGQVSGTLAVPTELSHQMNSSHLQER